MPTYQEYTAAGGQLTQTEFNKISVTAWAYLTTLTLGRAAVATGENAALVKQCFAKLCDTQYAQMQGSEVASASNDGYSETYVQSGKTAEQKNYAIVMQYLGLTGMLYRGC